MEVAPNWLWGMMTSATFLITIAAVIVAFVALVCIYGFNQDNDK